MLTSLFYLAAFATSASALAFPGAQATSQAEVGELVFPPEPTTGPKVHADLFRRQNIVTDLIAPDNTCGYISGLPGAGYFCNPTTDVCAFFPGTSTTVGFIGCCNIAKADCGARVTCVNSAQYYYSSVCDNGCEKDTFTLKCTAATAPYCNGIRFPKENVEDYFCDNTAVTTWQTAYTTYNKENDGRVFSPLTITLTSNLPTSGSTGIPLTQLRATSASTAASNPTGATSQNPQPASPTTSGPIATTTSPVPASSSSSTPIGAIVGGVVGGIAGLALIAVAVFFILRHNKKNNATDANNVPPPSYLPPQDPNNNSAYAAANGGKPNPTTQEAALAGQWAPAPTQTQYQPQMQEQQPYQPQMQEQQPYQPQVQEQQPYQPQIQEQQQYPQQPQQLQQYAPPMQDQQYPPSVQQQYPTQMQQQPYPNVAEVPGSYGHQPQQSMNAPYSQNQQSNPAHYSISSVGQASPNAQSHLSSTFPDRNDTTSPMSVHQASELGTPGGAQPPHSPSPTFVSHMGAPVPAAAPAPGVEGRAEMSANISGPFPSNAYEVPGNDVQRH